MTILSWHVVSSKVIGEHLRNHRGRKPAKQDLYFLR